MRDVCTYCSSVLDRITFMTGISTGTCTHTQGLDPFWQVFLMFHVVARFHFVPPLSLAFLIMKVDC